MRKLLLPLALLTLSACWWRNDDDNAAPVPVPATRPEVWVAEVQGSDVIYSGDDEEFQDSLRLVIRDDATYRLWWGRATPEGGAAARRDVDFTRYMVLLVSAGERNPGDGIGIEGLGFRRVSDSQSELWCVEVETTADPDPFPGDAYPLQFVQVPRTESMIAFREVGVDDPCPGERGI